MTDQFVKASVFIGSDIGTKDPKIFLSICPELENKIFDLCLLWKRIIEDAAVVPQLM